ncbi:uncharacterized protein LOC123538376 isoform X2 [Mercenaria mercenaria]|uniref:uncharacterized protein LOC123538376 isoform X2 n=1 Tax=Mercenaria mercenaria TaxID=6596 RepID=UPI00234EF38E|nr:uncharacterized protein LOC123538376 isoform X2 [Mercenaria mercenaria]
MYSNTAEVPQVKTTRFGDYSMQQSISTPGTSRQGLPNLPVSEILSASDIDNSERTAERDSTTVKIKAGLTVEKKRPSSSFADPVATAERDSTTVKTKAGLTVEKKRPSSSFADPVATFKPIPGDMIEFKRKMGYSHFGVYVGKGYVIHLTGNILSCPSSTSKLNKSVGKPKVKREKLTDVAGNSDYKVNNTREHELSADDEQTILDRASMYIGYAKYDLFEFNCETFASMCRYGRGKSKQAGKYVGNLKSIKEKDLSVNKRGRKKVKKPSTFHSIQSDTIREDDGYKEVEDAKYDKDNGCCVLI